MERLNASFLALVVLAAGVGVTTTFGYGSDLQAREDTLAVTEAVAADVTETALQGDALRVTATVRNPTPHDLTVTGVVVRVHNDTESKLAFATADRVAGGSDLPAGESLTATYSVRVAPSRMAGLRAALERSDAAVTIKYSLDLRGVSTQAVTTDAEPNEEGL